MTELVKWLGAQLDEDERIARAASGGGDGWVVAEQASCECCSNVRTGKGALVCTPDDDDAPHIAEWDPARVLREINAKRRILDEAAEYEPGITGFPEMWTVLRLLALPYADRPGYREEWRP